MTRRALVTAAVTLAVQSLWTADASAADTDDLEGLLAESIVTTASKTAERSSATPGTSITITSDDIRKYGIRTITEALDFLALAVYTSDRLDGHDVGARGMTLAGDSGSHFLVLIDGHAINEPLRGTARMDRGAGIPMELIDHIEVVIGPGSVLYGSNAMLGVVNVITKAAKDFSGGHAVVESQVPNSVRVGTGVGREFKLFGTSTELTTQVEYFGQRGPDFAFERQNTGQDFATYQLARYTRKPIGTGVWGGTAHNYRTDAASGVVRLIRGNLSIGLRGSFFKYNALTGPLNFDDPDQGRADRLGSIDVAYRAYLSSRSLLSARLYGDVYDATSHAISSQAFLCLDGKVSTCDTETSHRSRWAGAEIQQSYDWFIDGRLVSMVGLDTRYRFVQTETSVRNADTQASVLPVSGKFSRGTALVGAYAQQTFQATPSLGFNAGARLDYDPRFSPVVSPRIAASLNPWKGGTLKTSYSEAFRAPSFEETDGYGQYRLVAKALKPERVRSVEASIEQRVGPHRLLFGVFRSWWSDLVEDQVVEGQEAFDAGFVGQVAGAGVIAIRRFVNASDVDNYGINGGYDGSLLEGRLKYGVQATGALASARTAAGTTPLTVSPRVFGNAHVSYELGRELPTLGVAVHYISKRYADRAFDGGFRNPPVAPPLAEVRATASGTVPWVEGLSYRLIGNYSFADSGPYVVGPVQQASVRVPNASLVPYQRMEVTVGLQYDF